MYWYCSGSKSWPTLDTIVSFAFANLIGMNCDLTGVCICSITSTGEHMWDPHGRQWGREDRWKVREKKNKLETSSIVRSPQAQTDNCWKLSALIGPDPECLNILQKLGCFIVVTHTHTYRHAHARARAHTHTHTTSAGTEKLNQEPGEGGVGTTWLLPHTSKVSQQTSSDPR